MSPIARGTRPIATADRHAGIAQMDKAELRRLAAIGELLQVPAGEEIIREGDRGTCFYLVLSGSLCVTVSDKPDGAVAMLGSGDVVGEMAVVGNQPRAATVTATCTSRLLRVDCDARVNPLWEAPATRELLARVGLERTVANLRTTADLDDSWEI